MIVIMLLLMLCPDYVPSVLYFPTDSQCKAQCLAYGRCSVNICLTEEIQKEGKKEKSMGGGQGEERQGQRESRLGRRKGEREGISLTSVSTSITTGP